MECHVLSWSPCAGRLCRNRSRYEAAARRPPAAAGRPRLHPLPPPPLAGEAGRGSAAAPAETAGASPAKPRRAGRPSPDPSRKREGRLKGRVPARRQGREGAAAGRGKKGRRFRGVGGGASIRSIAGGTLILPRLRGRPGGGPLPRRQKRRAQARQSPVAPEGPPPAPPASARGRKGAALPLGGREEKGRRSCHAGCGASSRSVAGGPLLLPRLRGRPGGGLLPRWRKQRAWARQRPVAPEGPPPAPPASGRGGMAGRAECCLARPPGRASAWGFPCGADCGFAAFLAFEPGRELRGRQLADIAPFAEIIFVLAAVILVLVGHQRAEAALLFGQPSPELWRVLAAGIGLAAIVELVLAAVIAGLRRGRRVGVVRGFAAGFGPGFGQAGGGPVEQGEELAQMGEGGAAGAVVFGEGAVFLRRRACGDGFLISRGEAFRGGREACGQRGPPVGGGGRLQSSALLAWTGRAPCFRAYRVRAWPRAYRGGAKRAPDCARARGGGRTSPVGSLGCFFAPAPVRGEAASGCRLLRLQLTIDFPVSSLLGNYYHDRERTGGCAYRRAAAARIACQACSTWMRRVPVCPIETRIA